MPRQEKDKFLMRLPDGLRDIIKHKANENMRSMNAEMIFHLDKIFRPEEPNNEA